jgi:hypothetical protein
MPIVIGAEPPSAPVTPPRDRVAALAHSAHVGCKQ